jgi:hypothetical protein
MGCDAFRIDYGFIRRHVEMQVLLMNAPKTTQIGPERRASPRACIAVDLAEAISIRIPRLLVHTMTDSGMRCIALPIALPLVGIEPRAAGGDVLCNQCRAGMPIGMVAHPEALLTCVPRIDADNGGAVVGVGPMPSRLIGTPTGQIIRVRMGRAFFPRVSVQLVGLKGRTWHDISRGGIVDVGLDALPQGMELFA